MKKHTTLIILLFISWGTFAQDTLRMNLDQALTYAKQNNLSIKNADLEIEYSKQTVKSIVATGLPQISANGTFIHNLEIASQQLPDFLSPAIYGVLMSEGLVPSGPISLGDPQEVQFGAPSTMVGSVNLQQLVFDGTYFLGLKAAKEYVNMSQLMKENKYIDMVESVQKSYYGVLIAQKNLELMTRNLRSVEKNLREIQQMFDAGVIEKLDVDRMKLSRSTLATQLTSIKGQSDMMLLMFKMTIGMPIQTPLILTGNLRAIEESGMVRSDFELSNRIEYKILERQLKLDSMNVKRFKVGYVPSIYFNMSHQRNSFASAAEFKDLGKTWFPGTNYSVSLNVPVFDGFYKKAKISEASIKLDQNRNQFNDTKNVLAFQITQAELNYNIKKNNLANEELSQNLAREIYKTSAIKFKEGIGSSLELTQADSDRTQAEMRYANALYEMMVAKIELDKALGKIN